MDCGGFTGGEEVLMSSDLRHDSCHGQEVDEVNDLNKDSELYTLVVEDSLECNERRHLTFDLNQPLEEDNVNSPMMSKVEASGSTSKDCNFDLNKFSNDECKGDSKKEKERDAGFCLSVHDVFLFKFPKDVLSISPICSVKHHQLKTRRKKAEKGRRKRQKKERSEHAEAERQDENTEQRKGQGASHAEQAKDERAFGTHKKRQRREGNMAKTHTHGDAAEEGKKGKRRRCTRSRKEDRDDDLKQKRCSVKGQGSSKYSLQAPHHKDGSDEQLGKSSTDEENKKKRKKEEGS
ncbi:uncharacterized protein LOC129305666 [Prosopis cineraria]|uniref:uncharacterized protein LOC129305666 n=1 Tax=Prosopis cineraria TaxID=364024 RepID=UPI00240ECAAB|nr:uncharacterized protein LOC129305666 [Prosopis cineraria]